MLSMMTLESEKKEMFRRRQLKRAGELHERTTGLADSSKSKISASDSGVSAFNVRSSEPPLRSRKEGFSFICKCLCKTIVTYGLGPWGGPETWRMGQRWFG